MRHAPPRTLSPSLHSQLSAAGKAALTSITSLVVATSPLAAAFLRGPLGKATPAGAVILPELSLAGNSAGAVPPSPGDVGVTLFLAGSATMIALAQVPALPDGRAPALAAALVGLVPHAAAVVSLGSIPGRCLAGPGGAAALADAAGSGSALSLETPQLTAGVPAGAPAAPPPLPPGAAVTGLAAAVVGLAAAMGRPGLCVVGVDASAGSPPAAGLESVAAGMAAGLARAGVDAGVVDGVRGGAAAAAAELGAADKAAARSVVYF